MGDPAAIRQLSLLLRMGDLVAEVDEEGFAGADFLRDLQGLFKIQMRGMGGIPEGIQYQHFGTVRRLHRVTRNR
jgi:hypothetical protein